MREASNRPLVTFALFCYNQEKYIRRAVEAALAQDYPLLEIILSDDCSIDRSFQIMEEMAAAYSGAHRLKLNRNASNLGFGSHVQKLGEIAKGTIIVVAAGDDISRPQRVSSVVDVFTRYPDVFAVLSNISQVDENGQIISQSLRTWQSRKHISLAHILYYGGGVGPGAGYAYRTKCFHWPWPYPELVLNEDRILPLRAALMGRVWHIDRVLVEYRLSENGMSRRIAEKDLSANLKLGHTKEIFNTLLGAVKEGLVNEEECASLQNIYRLGQRATETIIEIRSRGKFFISERVTIKLIKLAFKVRFSVMCYRISGPHKEG